MSGERESTEEVSSGQGPISGERRYLFAIDGGNTNTILPLVCDLVAYDDAELVIGAPVVVPDQTPLSMPDPKHEGEREVAKVALKVSKECEGPPMTHQAAVVGHNRGHILNHIVKRYGVSTVLTEAEPPSGIRSMLGLNSVDEVALTSGCDTIIVPRTHRNGDIDSVLVPVARGPHSGMAIDIGVALARQNEASLELLHVSDGTEATAEVSGDEVLDHAESRVGSFEPLTSTLQESVDVPQAIVEYTDEFDVTVLGAPREGLLKQFVLGTIPDTVSVKADGTVLVAHRGDPAESWVDRWLV